MDELFDDEALERGDELTEEERQEIIDNATPLDELEGEDEELV